ncbi:hypothetical protein ACELLULO517_18125 [Acidisoma cellulosilytica]|uniref:Uncharacterized protein n=1 Tax=Acidisoma cellulosilyticum TaxID=2802395 RepID=A0A963Z3L4_9PROT|nr:hypothetical protein [Acidisoma cellulosilyticum]MCB8882169.1 hypothetical protein [Acidisoma cellulosilyticum]
MAQENSVEIALALIKRYGHQAAAIAEERAAIMTQQDPGLRHVWEQMPSVIADLRRSNAVQKARTNA